MQPKLRDVEYNRIYTAVAKLNSIITKKMIVGVFLKLIILLKIFKQNHMKKKSQKLTLQHIFFRIVGQKLTVQKEHFFWE